ncbi:proline--tRNA ligase [bacterium]|nr:proline--tRNA ligase [bacterium]
MAEHEHEHEEITPQSEDFSRWYVDVVRRSDMADYTSIKGCMVIKPYCYALWENVQHLLDRRIKKTGHKNAYFPLFIPESLLKQEAKHVEGFAPEVAWVTHGGQNELEERLAVRPTSEAIICSLYSKWVKSYRDLPLLINQWANVVRWEKVTRLFLRTTEFLWQEGHTVHRTDIEAQEETLKMLEVYKSFAEEDLAIPVIAGEKTARERFAGALQTFAVEALMADGRALQAGTSHNLGQNFSKGFNIKFLDEDQIEKYAWQTSWGVSTRLIGAIIMVHGRETGLFFPPRVAPIQVIAVPILFDKTRSMVLEKLATIVSDLEETIRIESDTRDTYTPGWKFNEWEMKGVPVRLELGPRDIQAEQAVLVRLDTREKIIVPFSQLKSEIPRILTEIQHSLLERARQFVSEHTHRITDYKEFQEVIEQERGFLIAPWCGNPDCEERIKEETRATIRVIPFEDIGHGDCLICGQKKASNVYFARAY